MSAIIPIKMALLLRGASAEEADWLINELIRDVRARALQEGAARLEAIHVSHEGADWNWWDASEIPASCAALLRRMASEVIQPT